MFTRSVYYLLRLPVSFHKNKKIIEIIEKFDRADFYLDKIINEGLLQIAPHVITSCLALVVIFWIRWELAVVYALFIIIFMVITIRKANPIIEFNKKINQLYNKIYGTIFERTPNVLTIKANTSELKEYQKNQKEYEKIYSHISEYTDLWMNLQLWQDIVFATGFLALFVLGLYLVQLGLASIGQFVMLLAYVTTASSSIQRLGIHYKEIQEGMMIVNDADKIFNETEENYDDPEAVEMEKCKGAVEFHNVSFSYDKRHRILKNISFKIKPGQMVAIVGRSGQGKTTLVDLIPRFFAPTEGKIMLDGIDIKKIKLESLRKQIGIVPQEIYLFHDSIRNNIRYSKTAARQEEIFSVAKIAHCHEFIHKFPHSYNTMVGDRGVKLSLGQRQRIAIARAVLRDPEILILDEATSSLDSESEKYIQDALIEVMKGRTTFVIAHRLSTIRKADLILVLDDGEIVERGNHDELMRHGGVYKKLHALQHVSI
jgi:ABC-type multidrug transport system fused ATPase/permease subunit